TAGIDTSKAKLDIAVHDRSECWQVANAPQGWRRLAADLLKAGVARVGIEATGGYERGVVGHLRAAGFTVLVLQPIQVRAFARIVRQLREHRDLAHRLDLVLSVPGIGERTALALIIRMPELGRISREEAAA